MRDVDVTLDITNDILADLSAFLISPSGTRVELLHDTDDDFSDTVLDDEAELSITEGTEPFTGHYRPVQPLRTATTSAASTTRTA